MAKPIHETLRHLMGGTFLDEAGEKLAELVAAATLELVAASRRTQ